MILLVVGFVLGFVSALLGYGFTTWQFWFITIPIIFIVTWVLRSL